MFTFICTVLPPATTRFATWFLSPQQQWPCPQLGHKQHLSLFVPQVSIFYSLLSFVTNYYLVCFLESMYIITLTTWHPLPASRATARGVDCGCRRWGQWRRGQWGTMRTTEQRMTSRGRWVGGNDNDEERQAGDNDDDERVGDNDNDERVGGNDDNEWVGENDDDEQQAGDKRQRQRTTSRGRQRR